MNQNLSRENQNDSFTRGLTDVLPQSAKQSGNSKAIAGAMRALQRKIKGLEQENLLLKDCLKTA